MKYLLILITIMFVGGCATTPTMESVEGTYELKIQDVGGQSFKSFKLVFLENGVMESYEGSLKKSEYKWKVKRNEIHTEEKNGDGTIYATDGKYLTTLAKLKNRKRIDYKRMNNGIISTDKGFIYIPHYKKIK